MATNSVSYCLQISVNFNVFCQWHITIALVRGYQSGLHRTSWKEFDLDLAWESMLKYNISPNFRLNLNLTKKILAILKFLNFCWVWYVKSLVSWLPHDCLLCNWFRQRSSWKSVVKLRAQYNSELCFSR